MVAPTKLWTSLALFASAVTGYALDKRAQSVIIGYRTVSPEAVQSYHDAGNTLTYKKGSSSDQLGPGAYISPVIGDWPMTDTNFDCAILADSAKWNLVNKAWVPETDDCKPLWYNKGAPNRDAYLKDIGGPGFTSANTVLLSQIHGFNKLQILIPPSLMGKGGGLGIHVQCAQKSDADGIAQISVYGDVDWYSWNNVKGVPQHV